MTPAECTISPVSVLTLLKCVSLQKREGERERERERGRERELAGGMHAVKASSSSSCRCL